MPKAELPQNLIDMADMVAASIRPFLERHFPPKDETSGRSFHVCSVIADATIDNYRRLKLALGAEDQSLCALGCRNLLELRVFMSYILVSEKEAKAFTDDRLIDGLQLSQALKDLELHLNPGLAKSQFDGKILKFGESIASEGVIRRTFFRRSTWPKPSV